MKSTLTLSAMTLISATVLGGCASNGPHQTSTPYSTHQTAAGYHGSIESIQASHASNDASGAGAVASGLVGGLLGNQIGNGNGRTAATVAGAVGGAVVGNNLEQNRNAPSRDMYRIRVRLDNGNSTTVTQDSMYDLGVGSRIRIVDGRVHRE